MNANVKALIMRSTGYERRPSPSESLAFLSRFETLLQLSNYCKTLPSLVNTPALGICSTQPPRRCPTKPAEDVAGADGFKGGASACNPTWLGLSPWGWEKCDATYEMKHFGRVFSLIHNSANVFRNGILADSDYLR